MIARVAVWLVAGASFALPLAAQSAPELQGGLEIKWIRDSEEYAAQSRMVYRVAERAVAAAARSIPRGGRWAVVLDLDETVLDNSEYQLSRLAYRLPYDTASWNAWSRRGEAGVVPGVVDFIASVRRLGGHVAWISNRADVALDGTRNNLRARNLWSDDDRLCLQTADAAYTKPVRRAELVGGTGACGWPGSPATVLAWVGDNIQDFPQAGENDPDAGNDAAFGTRYFMIANPMYGGWVSRITRKSP